MLIAALSLGCLGTTPESTENAPFEIGRLVSQLWVTSSETDEDRGEGFLILSTEEINCAQASAAGGDLEELVLTGNGLLFYLEYSSHGSDQTSIGWEGLWVGGYAYSPTNGDRRMVSVAFSDGFLYFLDGYYSFYFGNNGTWINIDSTDAGLKGSYQTTYWSGAFAAEDCGTWEEPTRDTGWDTSHWDDTARR